ncbi:MAG TPA: MBL fold metallo-hydrolase, partial [Tepidisphaeraceae bacterium]|nr:MBL fold metallo-hydrolase [Tepidisphaeraceae bacterium]
WRYMRLSPIAGLVLLALPWCMAIVRRPEQFRLTILSVGAGSCAVAESPDGHIAIFDDGSSTISEVERVVVKPFLRQRQIQRIDELFISHPDADHYNGVEDTMRDFPTHEVILDDAFVADSQNFFGARHLLKWLDQTHHWPRIVSPGDEILLGRDVSIKILWPPRGAHWGHNDDGMVVRLTYAGKSILIPADIESIAERQLINLCPDLPSDVLIAPHHGSSVDMTPFFVAKVNPEWIISSDDRTPTSKQLRFDREIKSRPLYHTHNCGAVTITISSHGDIAVQPFLPR